MNPNIEPAWIEPVATYVEIWKKAAAEGGIPVPARASEEKLRRLVARARGRGLHVDDQVLDFLRFVNGTGYDGLNFVGAEEDYGERGGDLVDDNDPAYDATDGDATVYGSQDDLTFRFSRSVGRFQVVDEGLNVVASFKTFGELIQHVFANEVARLLERDPARSDG